MESENNTNISRKFTRLYIIALSAVAILSISGQILVQVALDKQSSDSRVVNIAGRQRMLSQKICKDVILLTGQVDSINKSTQRAELEEALQLWQKYHIGLQTGNLDTIENKVNNSDAIFALFKKIDPHFLAIYKNSLSLNNTMDVAAPAYKKQALQEILLHEKLFLKLMDKIVFAYDKEARERVDGLQKIELALLCLTLVILIIEGLFIFRPAVAQLHKTVLKLINAEKRANDINHELLMANDSLQRKEEELLVAANEKYQQQMNEQKIRSTSLVKGQESERKRIAREMHDGLGQMLTALKLNIESIEPELLPEKEKSTLEETRKLIFKTIAEIRTITFNLMPIVLNDFGIISALKQLTDQATKISGVNVRLTSPGAFNRLNKNIEIGLYRIAQEAINNAVKYSQAKEISIDLSLNDNFIYLNISDNGKGFSVKKVHQDSDQKKINNGIYNMQERTNLLDGEFKLTTAPGRGTKIWAKIPVKYQ